MGSYHRITCDPVIITRRKQEVSKYQSKQTTHKDGPSLLGVEITPKPVVTQAKTDDPIMQQAEKLFNEAKEAVDPTVDPKTAKTK